MSKKNMDKRAELPAMKVHQWRKEWEEADFNPKCHRTRPDPYFYLFSLPASQLKALSGIYRRTTKEGLPRSQDLGIQRRHDEERSRKIAEFVLYGYPWSDLSQARRDSGRYNDLRKPGWLPTAIVVNILKPGDRRRGKMLVADEDIITVMDTGERTAVVSLPSRFDARGWAPRELHPIEVIDGQHRLWAFSEDAMSDDFELPVVAFHGLDISWQAYLFWSINVTPQRINRSLAFDLYPLLRTEDWLERFEGHPVYRETRAQEITEALWAHPDSPWHQRINMLGEPGLQETMVSQAAWVRSLMATYVRTWEPTRKAIGGLFGARVGTDEGMLPWSGAQQAAFLILAGRKIRDAIKACSLPWAVTLRGPVQQKLFKDTKDKVDAAFAGRHTLINTDQGVRGILYVTNDLCYILNRKLKLQSWMAEEGASATDEAAVNKALASLETQPVAKVLGDIADALAKYDWRTSSEPTLTEDERSARAVFRGSGGYRELRRHLLRHLAGSGGDVGEAAQRVLMALGYKWP